MATHVVPDDASRLDQSRLRVVLDTNVAGPALRWMAAGKRPPTSPEVESLVQVQRLVARRKLRSRVRKQVCITAFDLRLAALEGSREIGIVRGERLASMVAAGDVLADWLHQGHSLNGRTFAKAPPKLDVDASHAALLDNAREYEDHARIVLALLGLEAIHKRRAAGELRGSSQGLEALSRWETSLRTHVVLSPALLLIGVQVALGPSGPGAAMCKFHLYRDFESARRTAWNAAWDLTFLRAVGASEHGAFPYEVAPMAAVLVTSDRALAETAAALRDPHGVDHPVTGRRITGSILNLEAALSKAQLRDDRFMTKFHSWQAHASYSQQVRFASTPATRPDEETEGLVQQMLRERFPIAE